MFSVASVCLSFVCQHDNFRTTKCVMMKLGGYVQCTKILPQFKFGVKGQRSRSPGTKKKKVQHFFQERSSGARVVSSASSVRVGKSAHAV